MKKEELIKKVEVVLKSYYDIQEKYDSLVRLIFFDLANMKAETNKIIEELIELEAEIKHGE